MSFGTLGTEYGVVAVRRNSEVQQYVHAEVERTRELARSLHLPVR